METLHAEPLSDVLEPVWFLGFLELRGKDVGVLSFEWSGAVHWSSGRAKRGCMGYVCVEIRAGASLFHIRFLIK